jgi:RHS repeat-associated protein
MGFKGKEMDNKVQGVGNQQDYGLRIYDPRLGKFLSVDPLAPSFPWNSNYAFAENNVIRCIDLEGAESYSKVENEIKKLEDANDKDASYYRDVFNSTKSAITTGKYLGLTQSANNLAHFLEGSGTPTILSASWLLSCSSVRETDTKLNNRINSRVLDMAGKLANGESQNLHFEAAKSGSASIFTEPDLWNASGGYTIHAVCDITISKKDNGDIEASGTVYKTWYDYYNWDLGKRPYDIAEVLFNPPVSLSLSFLEMSLF